MLSVIRSSTSGIYYAVFTSGSIFDGIDVKITNGCDLYCHEGRITDESHKPQSRSKESKTSYMTTLYSALTSISISEMDRTLSFGGADRFVHEFNLNPTDDSIQLVIKECVANTNTMSILFRTHFQKQHLATPPLPTNSAAIMDIFVQLQTNLTSKQHTIDCLERENRQYQELNEQYIKDIRMLNDLKDNLQETMVQRMCVILNSKKLELQRLQDRIDELESLVNSGASSQSLGTQLAVQSQPQSETAAKRGRKKSAVAAPPPKRTPAAKQTATSVDEIQKRATLQAKTKSSGRNIAASKQRQSKGRKKGKITQSEEDEEEENSDDREFIVDGEEDENSSNISQVTESSFDGKRHHKRRKADSSSDEGPDIGNSLSTNKKPGHSSSSLHTQSFLTQKPQSLEVNSVDIMNFLSTKSTSGQMSLSRAASLDSKRDSSNLNGEGEKSHRSLLFGEPIRSGKRSFLSQDADEEFNAAQDPLNVSKSCLDSKPDVTPSAPTVLPGAKKKRSARFLDSDDEDADCLDYL